MLLNKSLIKAAVIISIALSAISASAQENVVTGAKRVMWEQVNISERNLYLGPGGAEMQPNLKKMQYLGKQGGGTQLKYRLKDSSGHEWVVKLGREAQSETAATRLLWAIGYPTEINYLVQKVNMQQIGNYSNVRFEARPDKIKRLEKWSWADNPFVGTNEFEGLKIMMAMFNNWDIKDENTAVLTDGSAHYYIISDLGATFGRLPEVAGGKSGRSVNKPEQYAEVRFIKQVRDGVIELDYSGKADSIIKTVKVEHGRWLADLLLQLSDKQIEDAFRAANYDDDEVKLLAQAFKARIKELDEATKPAPATTTATE